MKAEYDVIIVGGGGSGMAAALSAAEHGASTLLLEKAARLGGTTALSIGSITSSSSGHQKRAGIKDCPQWHFEDMPKFAPHLAAKDNEALRRVLVENVPHTLEWLIDKGLSFFGPMPEPPHRVPRMHNVLPNSRAYVYFLSRCLRATGVDIVTSAAVNGLAVEDGKVRGVSANVAGEEQHIAARRGVILASGDFSASPDFKGVHNPDLATVDAINPWNTGDGLAMGRSLGGVVLNDDLVFSQLRFVAPPTTKWIFRLPPRKFLTATMKLAIDYSPQWLLRPFILSFVTTFLAPEPAIFDHGAILVDSRGNRIDVETHKPHVALSATPEKTGYIIFDQSVAAKFSRWPHFISTAPGLAYAYFHDYRRNRSDLFHKGATIADLAGEIGVPLERLRASISADQEGPAAANGPFFALGPVQGWTILTDGGLAVTSEHQVVGKDGRPVPGLFAVGSVGQGGLVLEGHGHHLAWAFTSGRRAGRVAATGRAPASA